MSEKYDIRDKYGRKIGTAERRQTSFEKGQAAGDQIIGVVILMFLGVGFLLLVPIAFVILLVAIPNAYKKSSQLMRQGRKRSVQSRLIGYGILSLPIAAAIAFLAANKVVGVLLGVIIMVLAPSLMLFQHDDYLIFREDDNEWISAISLLTQKAYAFLTTIGGIALYGIIIYTLIDFLN